MKQFSTSQTFIHTDKHITLAYTTFLVLIKEGYDLLHHILVLIKEGYDMLHADSMLAM
jgi:hypothetical protein